MEHYLLIVTKDDNTRDNPYILFDVLCFRMDISDQHAELGWSFQIELALSRTCLNAGC